MGTPQTYTIPSTGIYRTPDGTKSFKFLEGTIVPMSLAIEFAMPDAGYDPPVVFNAAQQAAVSQTIATDLADPASPVATAVSALAGSAPAIGFPTTTFSGFTYDASTALGPLTDGTVALVANRLYAIPVRFAFEFVAENVAVYVTEAVAGNVIMGIYSQKANGFPGDLIVQGNNPESTGTTGDKAPYFGELTFDPGIYFIALIANATPTVRAYTANTGALWGSRGDGEYGSHFYVNGTYGDLPAEFPSIGVKIPSAAAPHLYAYRF